MNEEPIYEELKLGEKAKDAYLSGASVEEIMKTCPIYLNTRPVGFGLNATDLGIASILSGTRDLSVGDSGCGKSQEANDFSRYYFGGNISEGGRALIIEGTPELDIYLDILTRWDMDKKEKVLNGNHKALFWNLEEFNRVHAVKQNQFYAAMNNRLIEKGKSIPIGEDGFSCLRATANLGNGEYKGTFEDDRALRNRFGVVRDFSYEGFKPTIEDRILIDLLREADPGIKEAPIRDISQKIIQAHKKINHLLQNPSLEELAVINFLKFGLENCEGKTYKDESGKAISDVPNLKGNSWPNQCQDCSRNADRKYICSLIKAPQQRTLESMKRYSAGLYYLAKLKNPKINIDAVDLMFKAFELTGAYQYLLNPQILRADFGNENARMMKEVVGKIKEDFRANEDYILTSMELSSKNGKSVANFIEIDGKKYSGDICKSLNEKAIKKAVKLEPFTNNRPIGLEWMKDMIKLNCEIFEARDKK